MTKVGIDAINFYTSDFYLNLEELAGERGVDSDKFRIGIAQERMSFPSPDEDIVTMAANAALPIIESCDKNRISTVMLATETSVDQSKAASIFVHELLELPSTTRAVELKQACYSGTAGLQMACALVERNPEEQVLLIMSDIAKYDLDSPGEPTQGCGAAAILITANPSILVVSAKTGVHTENSHDFWRPNYRQTPVVDGKYSTLVYIKAAKKAFAGLAEKSKLSFDEIDSFCYHLPFSTMGVKAHLKVAKSAKTEKSKEELLKQLEPTLLYNKEIGNSYTASIYIALCSLLDNTDADLTGKKIAFFSFGSGCVGEFFYGEVVSGYKEKLRTEAHKAQLTNRTELSFSEYLRFYQFKLPQDGTTFQLEHETRGRFRLAEIKDHYRVYSKCER